MSFPNNRYGLDLLKLDSFMMLHLQISNWKMTLVMFQAVTKCWGRWEPFLLQSAPWRCRLICWEHQRFSGSMTNLMRTYLRCLQLGLLSQGTWGACQDNEFFEQKHVTKQTVVSKDACFSSSFQTSMRYWTMASTNSMEMNRICNFRKQIRSNRWGR